MTEPEASAVPIHAATTLILWREGGQGPEILMGQRGAGASFMPSKFVFPGGRVEPDEPPAEGRLAPLCRARMAEIPLADTPPPERIVGAGLRELEEETGLSLAPGSPLRFMFRAITPHGMPRRFDARFLLAPASAIAGDIDDFSAASGELSTLGWLPLPAARGYDLPFITEIVLAEAAALIAGQAQPGVPFFDNRGPVSVFRRLNG